MYRQTLACLWFCGCSATQAVVTVEVDEPLRQDLSRIAVRAMDEKEEPSGAVEVFDMRGAHALTPPFSFGALGDEHGTLRLRVVGLAEDTMLIEQLLVTPLHSGSIARITLRLRDECRLSICGDDPSCRIAKSAGGRVHSCTEGVTQALVTIEIDDRLLEDLSRIEVRSVTQDEAPTGRNVAFQLHGPQSVTPPVSFGALPDEGGTLRLRIVGLSEQTTVIEHLLVESLRAGSITRLRVRLREECRLSICGDRSSCRIARPLGMVHSCIPDEQRDAAVDSDVADDCGADDECQLPIVDGQADAGVDPDSGEADCMCSSAHIDVSCTGDVCDGACELGHEDCDKDKRTNGCETNLNTDPQHCGNCSDDASVCPYETCTDGICRTEPVGYHEPPGTREVVWDASRMQGQLLYVAEDAMVAGLGIHVDRESGWPNASFMLGIYVAKADVLRSPGELLASTPPMSVDGWRRPGSGMTSLYGGLEHPVGLKRRLYAGSYYWIFFISSERLAVRSFPEEADWLVGLENVSYAGLMGQMPPYDPSAGTVLLPRKADRNALYLITTPLP